MTLLWRRSALVWPDKALTREDDWTLVNEDGKRLARIYDAGREDGVEPGNWRWRIYRPNGTTLGGSAESGKDAKRIAEELAKDRQLSGLKQFTPSSSNDDNDGNFLG